MSNVKQIIPAASFIKSGDLFTVRIANPTTLAEGYLGLGVGFKLPGEVGADCVLSIGPDGTPQSRVAGTAGPWEVCAKQGGIACWSGTGQAFVLPCEIG